MAPPKRCAAFAAVIILMVCCTVLWQRSVSSQQSIRWPGASTTTIACTSTTTNSSPILLPAGSGTEAPPSVRSSETWLEIYALQNASAVLAAALQRELEATRISAKALAIELSTARAAAAAIAHEAAVKEEAVQTVQSPCPSACPTTAVAAPLPQLLAPVAPSPQLEAAGVAQSLDPALFDIAAVAFPTRNGETVRLLDERAVCAARAADRAQRPAPPAQLLPGAAAVDGRRLKLLSFISHGADFEPYADGYGEAMRALAADGHSVVEYNWAVRGAPDAAAVASFDEFDYVLVKSNWGWYLDEFARATLRGQLRRARLVLLISGTSPPPAAAEMAAYHTLFYETDWYWEAHAPALTQHGRAYKAFGINTRLMNRGLLEAAPGLLQPRPFDFVFVGHVSFTLKRADVLMQLPGARLALGVIDTADVPDVAELRAAGVVVSQGMGSYADLAAILRMARNVVVPTPIWGGGERATLEARACGAHVWVADDNIKLHELLCRPIPTHDNYTAALLAGLLNGMSPPAQAEEQQPVADGTRVLF